MPQDLNDYKVLTEVDKDAREYIANPPYDLKEFRWGYIDVGVRTIFIHIKKELVIAG